MIEHQPVMLREIVEVLAPLPGRRFVDATLGLAGHAKALLARLLPGGHLIGIDRDPEMLCRAERELACFAGSFTIVRARLSYLRDVIRGLDMAPVDGVLIDLGLCSAQLDDPDRGLSFRAEYANAPLDMRMDRTHGETAAQLLDRVDPAELQRILAVGDVPSPRRATEALLAHRPLRTVGDLSRAVESLPSRRRRHHPATLVFQALRMAVNDELRDVEQALVSAVDVLAPGGRVAVLSYHSGEDRRVKRAMQSEARGCVCPPDLPSCACGRKPRLRLLAQGTGPSPDEVHENPRARSARLRVGERL